MKRPLTIWCLVAASLVGVVAWADLVLVLKTEVVAGAAPIMTQPDAIFLQNGGSLNFTPTTTQGDNLVYSIDAMPGWSTQAFDTATGQLTGTAETGATTHRIRATNDQSGETYDIWLRVHVGSSAETIDATWLTNNASTASDGTTYYQLTTANRTYTLAQNVTVDGDAFYVTTGGVGLDLAGYTVTYNNATPITIPENSFETVSNWDFTNAANASRYAGVFLDNEVFDGTYSLRFDCPTANNEYVESSGTITLQPSTTYALSVMAHYGKKGITNADAPLIPSGLEIYAQLVGTGMETTIEISKDSTNIGGGGRFTRGIQLLTATFTTPAGTPTYNVRLGVNGGSNSLGDDVYFDLVKVTRYQDHGISSGFNKDSMTVSNGTITQGQDAGYDCDAVRPTGSDFSCLDALAVNVNGDDCNAVYNADGFTDRLDIQGCTFAQTSDAGSSRDNNTVSIVLSTYGNFVHNTISSGIHAGLATLGGWGGTVDEWDRAIAYNTISLNAFYTNAFAIFGGDTADLATEIYKNTISSGTGSLACRGIAPGSQIDMHDNTINVQALDNSQEYGGVATGGAYAVQHEGGYETATITGQVHTITGAGGGACVRVTGAATGIVTYLGATFTVDASSSVGVGTTESVPSVISTNGADLSKLILTDCNITTNCHLVAVGNGETGQLLFDGCTIAYVDDTIAEDYCLVNNFTGNMNVRFLDCTLADAGTATWFDAPVYGASDTPDSTNVTQKVANTCTITFTDGGSPVASTAVTVTDEQSTEVYSGTTSASGTITFVAEDWSRVNGTRTDFQTHTFNVTGYAAAQADLTSTNKTPTVALTASP